MAYVLALRASVWQSRDMFQRAIGDYRESSRLSPGHPTALNNFAWLIATKEFPGRESYKEEAINAANKVVSIQRTSNYLDTLACVHAYAGDFVRAAEVESEALAGAPSNAVFAARVQQFRSATAKDCTGAD
jgi:Tfp pilus assembly protein PilF